MYLKYYIQQKKQSRWRELNSRPLPYQGSALPLSYTGVVGAEDEVRTRDPQLGRLMLYRLSYFRLKKARSFGAGFWWEKMDSNHRRYKPADLQSAPFGHSGILPFSRFFLAISSLDFVSSVSHYHKVTPSFFTRPPRNHTKNKLRKNFFKFLSRWRESNPRPRDYKSRALAN